MRSQLLLYWSSTILVCLFLALVWHVVAPASWIEEWTGSDNLQIPVTLSAVFAVLVVVSFASYQLTAAELHKAYQHRLRFLRQASHQLRSPIASIIAYADILNEQPPDDPALRSHFLNIMASEARSLSALIDSLLILARLDAKQASMDLKRVDLVEMVQAEIDAFRPVAAERNISLRMLIDGDIPPLLSDHMLLKQVLTNLIDNAIKYNQPNGRIRLTLRRQAGNVIVAVSDTGQGIAPEHQVQIFEEFYRERRPENGGARGSGLGLTIVKQIVGLLGGSITVKSAPAMGSTFTVSFPWISPGNQRSGGLRLFGRGSLSSQGAPGWLAEWSP